MADHPIQGLMQTAMENIKEMVDVNTIVGEPVETPDGSVILPISRVGFGFAAGGAILLSMTNTINRPQARPRTAKPVRLAAVAAAGYRLIRSRSSSLGSRGYTLYRWITKRILSKKSSIRCLASSTESSPCSRTNMHLRMPRWQQHKPLRCRNRPSKPASILLHNRFLTVDPFRAAGRGLFLDFRWDILSWKIAYK